MEIAIIIFFISVGLVVIVPVLLLIIQGIRNYCRKRKRQKSAYQKTENKIPEVGTEASEKEPFQKDSSRVDVQPVSEAAGYGEFRIYECLKSYEEHGCKFLFNAYLPKNNGETTEIDVLMISPKGIFVFESKDLSGNIVVDEKSRYWTHVKTDERGETIKEEFFNPIMQNNIHIQSLQAVINSEYPVFSIVVFSEKCTLCNENSLTDEDTHIVTINDLKETVEAFYKYMGSAMSDSDIEAAYRLLYPYTQVSDSVKIEHIRNIQNKYQLRD